MLYTASTVVPFEEDSIPVVNLTSTDSIKGLALSYGKLRTVESSALLFTAFGFNGYVSSISARVVVSRAARIQDKTVRFRLGNSWLGPDLSNLSAANVHVYTLAVSANIDSSFGLVLDYMPHSTYPSSNTLYIRSVEIEFGI